MRVQILVPLSVLLGLGAAACADILRVSPDHFSAGAEVITFDEVPLGTELPFRISSAQFGGLGGFVTDAPSDPPPSPSGLPYLYTRSVGNDDTIEVTFDSPQTAAGAYFNLEGARQNAVVSLEFYRGADMLGALPAIGIEGFLGGRSDAAPFDRIVFRDIDDATSISFRIDDVVFIPSPGPPALFWLALSHTIGRRHRRPAA